MDILILLLFFGFFIFLFIQAETPQKLGSKKQNIFSVNLSITDFLIGITIHTDKIYYVFYVETKEYGKSLRYIEVDNVVIFNNLSDGEQPYAEFNYSRNGKRFIVDAKLFVPENTQLLSNFLFSQPKINMNDR